MSEWEFGPPSPELDPRQQALGGDFPPRIEDQEAEYHADKIEQILCDDQVWPFLDLRTRVSEARSTEAERVLTPNFSPGDYVRMARKRAFGVRTPKGRITNRYSAGPALLMAQEKEVLENTIMRIGWKFYKMQSEAEQFSKVVGFDETEPDTAETIAHRGAVFKQGFLTGQQPVADAYELLRKFSASAALPVREHRTYQELMTDAMQTDNLDRLDRLAWLSLLHLLKRADFYLRIHTNFTHFREEERRPIWERHKVSDLHTLLHGDSEIGRKLAETRRQSVSQGVLELTSEELERHVQPLVRPEPSWPPIPGARAIIMAASEKFSEYSDPLERLWRSGLSTLRQIGSVAARTFFQDQTPEN